jgi:hypothetical protein
MRVIHDTMTHDVLLKTAGDPFEHDPSGYEEDSDFIGRVDGEDGRWIATDIYGWYVATTLTEQEAIAELVTSWQLDQEIESLSA